MPGYGFRHATVSNRSGRCGSHRECRWPKLLLHARPENDKPNPGYQESYRERCRDLCGFFFVHSCFDGTEFGHFFLLVVVEIGMDQSNHTQNHKDDSESSDQALHKAEPFLLGAAV